MVNPTRKEKITNTKKTGILRLLSAPDRYIKCKIKSIYKKLVQKEPKKTDDEVYNEEKLKMKTIDKLKEIAKLRRIKNRGKLKKEGLITSILKSESSNAERNYMKRFNINTKVDNNNVDNNNTNDDDDTYDGKKEVKQVILE